MAVWCNSSDPAAAISKPAQCVTPRSLASSTYQGRLKRAPEGDTKTRRHLSIVVPGKQLKTAAFPPRTRLGHRQNKCAEAGTDQLVGWGETPTPPSARTLPFRRHTTLGFTPTYELHTYSVATTCFGFAERSLLRSATVDRPPALLPWPNREERRELRSTDLRRTEPARWIPPVCAVMSDFLAETPAAVPPYGPSRSFAGLRQYRLTAVSVHRSTSCRKNSLTRVAASM